MFPKIKSHERASNFNDSMYKKVINIENRDGYLKFSLLYNNVLEYSKTIIASIFWYYIFYK